MTQQTTQSYTGPLAHYYQALDRLKTGKPIRVPKGTKITNDAVSLEAGMQKGSIKRSRPMFTDLIEKIDEAAGNQKSPMDVLEQKLAKAIAAENQLRGELDAARGREISLLYELFETKQKLEKLTGEKVLPLRPPGSPEGGDAGKSDPR